MPELPDIAVYIECLERRIAGETLERARIGHPFLVRTVEPPLGAVTGKRVLSVSSESGVLGSASSSASRTISTSFCI